MEITKKPKIKSIPYDEFIDNESLEKLVKELNAGGANVALGVLDDFINWGRSNSLWPLTFATSCCGIEFMALGAARYDMARFGFEVARASPRQADMIDSYFERRLFFLEEDLHGRDGKALSGTALAIVSHGCQGLGGDHQPKRHIEPAERHRVLRLGHPRRVRGVLAHPAQRLGLHPAQDRRRVRRHAKRCGEALARHAHLLPT